MPGPRTLAIVALLAASALCVATVEIRTHETGDAYYRFLLWNLILAWVPLVLAMGAYGRARRRVDLAVGVLLGSLHPLQQLGRAPAPDPRRRGRQRRASGRTGTDGRGAITGARSTRPWIGSHLRPTSSCPRVRMRVRVRLRGEHFVAVCCNLEHNR
jgi:hypothetical protein